MTGQTALNYVLGVGFLLMFVMLNLAINERNEARAAAKAQINMNGAVITVTCKENDQ